MSKGQNQKTTRKDSTEPPKAVQRGVNAWPILASLSILAFGLYRAIDLRWICDDAFISMRYVKNFVEGNGLVYNIGERVEGYTHFLWLLILSASKAIGFDPVDSSIWLGIASYAGILLLLLVISYREHKKSPRAIWLPVAAAFFALNYDTAVWASGGLETSFYTLLILSAFYVWFYARLSEVRRLVLAGMIFALISLTRPDGVLFTVTSALLMMLHGMKNKYSISSSARSIGLLLLPSIVLGVPYLIWKYYYYGNLLPMTYYAKSANENYFGQGFFYIWLYARVYFSSAIAFIAAIWLLFVMRQPGSGDERKPRPGSAFLTALVWIIIYLILFVARSGGDFMFARFIIPVVPLILFLVERGLNNLPEKILKYRTAIAIILLTSLLIENNIRTSVLFHFDAKGKQAQNFDLPSSEWEGSTRGIADERWAYYYGRFQNGDESFGALDVYSRIGQYLEPFFEGLPITVAIPGATNMVAYYANFPTSINEYGLTDSFVAHMPITVRGRIGHEKRAPEQYLIKRNVDFELGRVLSEFPKQLGPTTIVFEIPELGLWQAARLVTYNKETMNELARRFAAAENKSVFPLFEKLIPEYMKNVLPTVNLSRAEMDYAGFRQFYFNRYPDSGLEHRFEERIAELKRDSIMHK